MPCVTNYRGRKITDLLGAAERVCDSRKTPEPRLVEDALRSGGYGWTRTTDTGIMSAVL